MIVTFRTDRAVAAKRHIHHRRRGRQRHVAVCAIGHAVPRLARRTTGRIDKWRTPLLAVARVGGKSVASRRAASHARLSGSLFHTRLRKSQSSCTRCTGTFSTNVLFDDYKMSLSPFLFLSSSHTFFRTHCQTTISIDKRKEK